MSEALNLQALRVVAAKARADYESYYNNDWALDYAEDVPALIAEIQRIRDQNAEALRIAQEGADHYYPGFWHDSCVEIVRVLGAGDD